MQPFWQRFVQLPSVRVIVMGMALLLMGGDPALGQGETTDLCKIEDWRYWHIADQAQLNVEGRVTCERGKVSIFAYTGPADTRQFIGSDSARIRDFIFTAKIKAVHVQPESLAIRALQSSTSSGSRERLNLPAAGPPA